MRIWDISPDKLCRAHLLGEHNELHAIWNILTQGRKGYANHPETKRWKGKLKALFRVHEEIDREMLARGYRHQSPPGQKACHREPASDCLCRPYSNTDGNPETKRLRL